MARISLAREARACCMDLPSSMTLFPVVCSVLADLSSDLSRTVVLPLQACPALLLMLQPRAWQSLPLPPLRLPHLSFPLPHRARPWTAMH
jgi:hypothetical protein